MIHHLLNTSVLHPSQNIVSNSLPSSSSEGKSDRRQIDKANPKLYPPSKDQKSKLFKDSSINKIESQIEGVHSNEDICFKCKKVGQLFCCQNCFRSLHWKCIGSKKLEELNKMTHVTNFICESCENQNICTKCFSTHPLKNTFGLIDYSDHNSVLSFYKCTHCYSRIHRKCYDVPYEALEKSGPESRESDALPHYVCVKCLENVGITEIIRTQRFVHHLGVQKLYFLVLLNTNSPTHKGWFEEITLSQHMKKFADHQTYIDDFLKDKSLYQYPEIDKIIQIRFPSKHKNILISDVMKIIQGRTRNPVSQKFGNPDNFKFLIKWKQRDYTCLSWEDQTIILKNMSQLKRFLAERQKWNCIIKNIDQHKNRRNSQNPAQQINYKVLEYFLTEKPQIKLRYLHINKQIDPFNKLEYKPFQERMQSLDVQNSKEPFIQLIEIECEKTSIRSPYEYMDKLVLYFQKIYLAEIILRPILIISDEVKEWEEALKNQKKYKEHYVRFIKFFGGKQNTSSIKRLDFFASINPCILKFDILLLDYNYFLYEKEYIFQKIPSFFAVLFDKSQKYTKQTDKLDFLNKHYFPCKSKVHKQIYLVDNSYIKTSVEDFARSILKLTESTANPVKKSLSHTLDFTKFVRFNSSEPKLKLIINKKFKQCTNIFQVSSNQILNEGQRLSFLKFILSYGLNVKTIEEICVRLRQMNPSIWSFELKNMEQMKQVIKIYTPMLISVVSKDSKQTQGKIDSASLNYFLFGYKSEMVLKRIIQLKKLKAQIEQCSEDRSKFPITKMFSFFSSGQIKPFPLWSIYEDYTLGALIIQEGYQRWNKLINSEKWGIFHQQLQKRRMFQYDHKKGIFNTRETIVPIKRKFLTDNFSIENTQSPQNLTNEQKRSDYDHLHKSQDKDPSQIKIITYGDYLIHKIKNSKEIKENQYQKLFDVQVLQVHIAQRGDDIVNQMN